MIWAVLFALAGFGCVIYGIALIYPPAALIVGGLLLLGIASRVEVDE